MKPLLNRKMQLAFGFSIALLLVVGAISYHGIGLSDESNRWVQHTYEVLENLDDLLLTMQTAESSYRGFLITGNERFLEPYRDNMARSQEEETVVRNSTADNPGQQIRLAALEMLTVQSVQYAETAIDLRRTKGLGAAVDFIQSAESARLVDEYKDEIRNMQNEEMRLLALRRADSK